MTLAYIELLGKLSEKNLPSNVDPRRWKSILGKKGASGHVLAGCELENTYLRHWLLQASWEPAVAKQEVEHLGKKNKLVLALHL